MRLNELGPAKSSDKRRHSKHPVSAGCHCHYHHYGLSPGSVSPFPWGPFEKRLLPSSGRAGGLVFDAPAPYVSTSSPSLLCSGGKTVTSGPHLEILGPTLHSAAAQPWDCPLNALSLNLERITNLSCWVREGPYQITSTFTRPQRLREVEITFLENSGGKTHTQASRFGERVWNKHGMMVHFM